MDELKVDRSFIVGMADPEGHDITGAIFGIARALGLETVAEGVEDGSVIGQLRGWGCDQVQGFLYARPEPLAKVRRAIKKDKPRRLPPPA